MKEKDKNIDDIEDPVSKNLLTDDEFSDLITNQYEQTDFQENNFAKGRVWKRLDQKLFQRKSRTPSFFNLRILSAGLATAACLIVALIYLKPREDLLTEKGSDLKFISVEIQGYFLQDGIMTKIENPSIKKDTIVVFKAMAQRDSAAAVVVFKNAAPPKLIVNNISLKAYTETVLEKDGNVFGYQMDPDISSATFCIIGAIDQTSLDELILDPDTYKKQITSDNCIELKN